jgi:putative FmdB family regulatory protein
LPTYEYSCAHCDKNFDVVQSFQDEPLSRCPTCDSPVKKVFGNVGIVFKGSGFYKTDSRNGGSTKKDKESSTLGSSNSEGSGSGGEKKTESTSEGASSPKEKSPSTDKPSSGSSEKTTTAPAP